MNDKMDFGSEMRRQMDLVGDGMADVRARSNDARDSLRQMTDAGLGALSRGLRDTSRQAQDTRTALRGMLEGLAKDMIRYGAQAMGGGTGNTGIGGLISDVLGFRASGGRVAAGGAYVVGERGPELLFPGTAGGHVAPIGGQSGSGAINVTVINNSQAQVRTEERSRDDGGRDISFVIDDMIAGALSNADSRAARVLKTRYGLSPGLTQR